MKQVSVLCPIESGCSAVYNTHIYAHTHTKRSVQTTDVATQTGDSLATAGLCFLDFKHNTTEYRSLYGQIQGIVTPLMHIS